MNLRYDTLNCVSNDRTYHTEYVAQKYAGDDPLKIRRRNSVDILNLLLKYKGQNNGAKIQI